MKDKIARLLKNRDEISRKIFEFEEESSVVLAFWKREKEIIDREIIG